MNRHNQPKELAAHPRGNPGRKGNLLRSRSRGQALVIIALSMVVLILFVGLGVDAANLMGRKAKLQSAVDVATLSAAQMLADDTGGSNTQPDVKARQVLEANGVPNASLDTPLQVTVNAQLHQVSVHAVQQVDTFFMRIIPAWRTVNVNADATADLNSYAEVDAKPYGFPGVVTQLNLMVWGADSRRHNGDDYSPYYMYSGYSGYPGPPSAPITNTEHQKQPYGYLYRVSVPASYAYPDVVVQVFDPDSYNRPGVPTPWATATVCVPNPPPGIGQTCNPAPLPNPDNPDMYADCGNPSPAPAGTTPASAGCSSNSNNQSNPAMKLNGFPDRLGNPDGRPAFWRVDELRKAYDEGSGEAGLDHATNTKFSLYHFDPTITSAFGDPASYADNPVGSPIATYTVRDDTRTDLRWFQPPGFKVHLADYAQELNGQGWSFYLFVEGLPVPSGSAATDRSASENNYDLRAGPPNGAGGVATNDACDDYDVIDATDAKGYPTSHCYVNKLYFDQMNYLQGVRGYPDVPDWIDGGVHIFAKRSLPLNLDTGTQFPMRLTQVNKNAGGQVLQIRHFDQDCGGAYPCNSNASKMTYQMQLCDSPYGPDDDRSYDSVHTPSGDVVYGWMSSNDLWNDGTHTGKELVQVPTEPLTTPVDPNSDYVKFFGADGHCSSWLRIYRYPSSAQDTSVWEIPYIRPRLIK